MDVGGVSMADSQVRTEGGDWEVISEVMATVECHLGGCEVRKWIVY